MYTIVISSVVEKSPAVETARYAPAPAHLPAGVPCRTRLPQNTCPWRLATLPVHAHRREIPHGRNDDTRTQITDQANTLNATVIARSAATWQSPGREDLLAYTDKILAGPLARGGSLPRNPMRQKRHATYPRRPTRQRWLTAEKPPAIETRTIIPAAAKCPHGLRAAPTRSPVAAHRTPRQKSHSNLHRRQNTIIQFSEV